MSGKYSRNKGARNERLLVGHLRENGYIARRIPLSGACEGFKGDVMVELPSKVIYGELKTRRNEFGFVYAVMARFPRSKSVQFSIGGYTVLMSHNLEYLGFSGIPLGDVFLESKDKQDVKKLGGIVKYVKWVKDCDFLCIKDDRKPFIFLRYIK